VFKIPAGPQNDPEYDFIKVPLDNLDFMNESVLSSDSTIVSSEIVEANSLDINRLKDANDDYDEILVDPDRKW